MLYAELNMLFVKSYCSYKKKQHGSVPDVTTGYPIIYVSNFNVIFFLDISSIICSFNSQAIT